MLKNVVRNVYKYEDTVFEDIELTLFKLKLVSVFVGELYFTPIIRKVYAEDGREYTKIMAKLILVEESNKKETLFIEYKDIQRLATTIKEILNSKDYLDTFFDRVKSDNPYGVKFMPYGFQTSDYGLNKLALYATYTGYEFYFYAKDVKQFPAYELNVGTVRVLLTLIQWIELADYIKSTMPLVVNSIYTMDIYNKMEDVLNRLEKVEYKIKYQELLQEAKPYDFSTPTSSGESKIDGSESNEEEGEFEEPSVVQLNKEDKEVSTDILSLSDTSKVVNRLKDALEKEEKKEGLKFMSDDDISNAKQELRETIEQKIENYITTYINNRKKNLAEGQILPYTNVLIKMLGYDSKYMLSYKDDPTLKYTSFDSEVLSAILNESKLIFSKKQDFSYVPSDIDMSKVGIIELVESKIRSSSKFLPDLDQRLALIKLISTNAKYSAMDDSVEITSEKYSTSLISIDDPPSYDRQLFLDFLDDIETSHRMSCNYYWNFIDLKYPVRLKKKVFTYKGKNYTITTKNILIAIGDLISKILTEENPLKDKYLHYLYKLSYMIEADTSVRREAVLYLVKKWSHMYSDPKMILVAIRSMFPISKDGSKKFEGLDSFGDTLFVKQLKADKWLLIVKLLEMKLLPIDKRDFLFFKLKKRDFIDNVYKYLEKAFSTKQFSKEEVISKFDTDEDKVLDMVSQLLSQQKDHNRRRL